MGYCGEYYENVCMNFEFLVNFNAFCEYFDFVVNRNSKILVKKDGRQILPKSDSFTLFKYFKSVCSYACFGDVCVIYDMRCEFRFKLRYLRVSHVITN